MDNGTLALMIPIIAVGGPMVIGFFGLLSRHQQKMAELIHANAAKVDPRVDALQREVADLKELVHQQIIALDRLGLGTNAEIRERVGG